MAPIDRIRHYTPAQVNEDIDRRTLTRVTLHAHADETRDERMRELGREWDVEQALELTSAVVALTGIAAAVNRRDARWLAVSVVSLTFLAQHAVRGWCLPVALFRRFGVRTHREIGQELYALKALRGDFVQAPVSGGPRDLARRALDAARP